MVNLDPSPFRGSLNGQPLESADPVLGGPVPVLYVLPYCRRLSALSGETLAEFGALGSTRYDGAHPNYQRASGVTKTNLFPPQAYVTTARK